MKRFTIILMLSILLLPLITSIKIADSVVGGPYTDKVSAELGSSNKSSGKGFSPDEIIVSVGTTVTWTNKDTVGHTVTSGSPNDPDAGEFFDSGSRWAPGEKFEHTFDAVGEFSYFCRMHPWTMGKVVVAEVVIQEDGIEDIPEEISDDDVAGEIGDDVPDQDATMVRRFYVEDSKGDYLYIRASSNQLETIQALTEMGKTGETKMIGGEIESFENDWGFRFKPATIIVEDDNTEELQMTDYRTIKADVGRWEGMGTVYISGKVANIRDEALLKYDESSFKVTTSISNGTVTSVNLDPNSRSLRINVETSKTSDAELTVILPRELIDSKNDGMDKQFIVNVGKREVKCTDGKFIECKELKATNDERKLRILVPSGVEQVEIIGTQIVPEFPLGLAVVLAGLVSVIVVITRLNLTNKILNV